MNINVRAMIRLLGFCLMLLGTNKAFAHALEQSYLFLSINDTSITGRSEITIADLNLALSLNLPEDHSVTKEQIAPHIEGIKQYYADKVKIHFQDGLVLDDYQLTSTPEAQYLTFSFTFDGLTALPDTIQFEYNVLFDVHSNHSGFVVIENDWRSSTFDQEGNIALVFTASDRQQTLDLTGATVMQGYWGMLRLGIHHIWEGIDHILFLIALLLPSVMYRKDNSWIATDKFYSAFIYVVKVVTVFTLAHTVTLSAATLGWVSLPSRLVESIIAISIAIAALDILYPVFRGRIWVIVFVFGLFHGFGFASVLAEYQIPDSYLTYSLLAFNLGVEVGQVAIVAVAFPVLYVLRATWFYPQVMLRYGAAGLIVVSLYWFIERGFMIDLPAGAAVNWVLGSVGLSI